MNNLTKEFINELEDLNCQVKYRSSEEKYYVFDGYGNTQLGWVCRYKNEFQVNETAGKTITGILVQYGITDVDAREPKPIELDIVMYDKNGSYICTGTASTHHELDSKEILQDIVDTQNAMPNKSWYMTKRITSDDNPELVYLKEITNVSHLSVLYKGRDGNVSHRLFKKSDFNILIRMDHN